MLSEPLLVVAKLADGFEPLGIRYMIGGSLASSLYGAPRATQDVDLVADTDVSHAEAIEQMLAGEHLERWASHLDVVDLLARARQQL